MIATMPVVVVAILLFTAIVPCQAQHPDTALVFRAMRAELDRSMRELRLGDLERPYHIEYLLTVRRRVGAHGVLGSVEDQDTGTSATVTVRVRVGNETFDNTNFFDVSLGFFGTSDDEEAFRNRRLPFELNERTLRRELWLATDACYKQAVELFAKKQAAIKNRTRIDTIPDFILLPPAADAETRLSTIRGSISDARVLVSDVSAIFAAYPDIQSSRVGMEIVPEETFYMSTEGRRFHKVEVFTGIEMIAVTQADDGMPLAQTYAAYGVSPSDLPPRDSLLRAARAIANILVRQKTAPIIEAYSGPVLVEGQAAGELFAQHFAPNLVAQRSPISEGGFSTNDRFSAFQNKIGARVLPEFLSVNSVPSLQRVGGAAVASQYTIDDEGVRAQDITVVDKGYLKTLLSSRLPTKRIRMSNGHQRGGAAMIATTEVTTVDPKRKLSSADLKKRMLKLVKDRALPYGIIIRKALNQNLLFTGIYPLMGSDYPIPQGEGKTGILEAVRVFADGREELIRGVEAAGLAPSLFKDIVATGKTQTVHNALLPAVAPAFITGGSQYLMCTMIIPDVLFEDLEIRPLQADFPKPPLLPSPLHNSSRGR